MSQDNEKQFRPAGLSREHWKTSAPVRKIFAQAFEAVGLPAFSPHSFRKMIVHEMYRRELPLVTCKAWSQNLGHESAMTTLTIYGKLSLEEQGREILRGFAGKSTSDQEESLLKEVRKFLENKNKKSEE